MNNNIEILELDGKKTNKKIYIIVIVVIVVIALIMGYFLATKNKKQNSKDNQTQTTNLSVEDKPKELVEIQPSKITRSTRIDEDKITVILTNNLKEAIDVDKIVIKSEGETIYESTETITVRMEEPTYFTVLPTKAPTKIKIYLYELKETDGNSEPEIEYKHTCVTPLNNATDYFSVMYYEFNYDEDGISDKNTYEILTFTNKEKYQSFNVDSFTSKSLVSSIEKDDDSNTIKYLYDFYFEPLYEVEDEKSYMEYLEKQGFNCK